MENNLFTRSANRLEAHLGKNAHEFTKDDIKQVVEDLNIKMVNFMYPAGDGRLKTLNFMLHTPTTWRQSLQVASALTALHSSASLLQEVVTSM